MPATTPRSLLAVLTVLAATWAGPVGASNEPLAGADGTAPPDVRHEVPADLPAPEAGGAFPLPEGVDLGGLGYQGPPLDAGVIESAGAELPGDPHERVAEISTRLAELDPQLEGLREAEGLVAEALAGHDREVAARQGVEARDRLRAEDTDRRLVDARARLRQRDDQLLAHRRQMVEVAIAAYVRPPDADSHGQVLGDDATTTGDLAAGVLFSAKADHDGDVRDQLEVARAVAAERLGVAVDAAVAARERLADAEARRVEAEARQAAHREALDALTFAHSVVGQAVPALQADMDRTIEQTWGSVQALADGGVVDGGAIVNVDGIRVHAAIAPRLQALLVAAHADGVPLGGWGHRSIDSQIRLRTQHCGPTPEDIWLRPAATCSPPTARPGSSMHERGLAIDFHLAGRSIASRSSPGFQWLARHAASYGLYNLPSEPWHWSVNGR